MKAKQLFSVFVLILLTPTAGLAQKHPHNHVAQRPIEFPDVEGFHTMVCDLHMHSVFSDGAVWPHIRVEEALRDGLDCIAITEHLEYQPHKDDIPHPDRNRAFEIASNAADQSGLIVINGSEITRSMPPGHANAIFVTDPNKLLVDEASEAYAEAQRQGAFVFWNHPDWIAQRKDGVARLDDMHRQLIEADQLHGIEVVNTLEYSEDAFRIALEEDLTIIGTSDIHGLIDWDYEVAHGGHRPVTMILATERTEQAIHDALRAKRTVVWHNNLLIGRPEHVEPVVKASLEVKSAEYVGDTSVLSVMISNSSDARYILNNKSNYTFQRDHDVLELLPHHTTELRVRTFARMETVSLPFEILNVLIAPDEYLEIALEVQVGATTD